MSACPTCHGEGGMIRCPDDLCYGQDECIHGDAPVACETCGGEGEVEDGPDKDDEEPKP